MSFNPAHATSELPESLQVRLPSGDRLSAPSMLDRKRGSVPNPNDIFGPGLATDLHLVGQAARLGSKTTSRPSTSWNEKRNSRVDQHEETDTALDISMPAKRPMSMSNIPKRDSNEVMVRDGAAIVKRNSVRQVQVVAQSVQIVDQQEPARPSIAPITPAEPYIGPALPAHAVAVDASAVSTPEFSSASTVVGSHSNSQSVGNGERKSWNPRTLFALLKDRNIPEPIVVHNNPPVSNGLPTPEFKLDLVLPATDGTDWASDGTTPIGALSTNGSNRGSWSRRPQTTAFETYNFSSPRFSGVSDLSSVRMSDPHAHFNLSNMSSESIPTLMPGAEKSTRLDSHVTGPSDLQPRRAVTDEGSPIKSPYRESALRNELSIHERSFHMDSAVGLSEEPAEDDEPIKMLEEPEVQFHHQQNNLESWNHELSEDPAARRMTISATQFLSAHSNHQQLDDNTHLTPKRNTLQHTPSTTRPTTRSQPIVIDAYETIRPVTETPPQNIDFSNAPDPTPVEDNRFRALSKPPVVFNPPEVSATEIKHMTAASLAFLREQEQLLIRRSTIALGQLQQQPEERSWATENDEIGMAISPGPASDSQNDQRASIIASLPDFSRPRKAPRPEKRSSHSKTGSTAHEDMFYEGPLPYSPQDHPRTRLSRTQPTTASHTPRTGSISFTKIGSRKFLASRVPAGTVSMVDLNQAGKNTGANAVKKRWKKERWWKIWRLV